MNIIEAKARVKALAAGKYHTVKYEFSEYSDETTEQECSVYINTLSWYTAPTWKMAIEKLEMAIKERKISAVTHDIENIEEIKNE